MVCFGQTRKVSWQSTISVGGARYSVPHQLIDERVWARVEGEQLIVIHVHPDRGPLEVARHPLTRPGRPQISDQHHPPRPPGALARRPRASSTEEQAFLSVGPAAETWLIRAAAAGVRRKMGDAVDLAKLYGADDVCRALRWTDKTSPTSRPIMPKSTVNTGNAPGIIIRGWGSSPSSGICRSAARVELGAHEPQDSQDRGSTGATARIWLEI